MEDYKCGNLIASVSGDNIEILILIGDKFIIATKYPKCNFVSAKQALDRYLDEIQGKYDKIN